MATLPPEPAPATSAQTHKAAQAVVVAGVPVAVGRALDLLNPTDLPGTMPKLQAALYALVNRHGKASAQLARTNYLYARAAAGLSSRPPRLQVTAPPPLRQVAANLDRLAADMLANLDQHPDIVAFEKATTATIERLILDTGRDSTIGFVEQDKGALGFVRIARPDACYFCLAQAMRRKKPQKGEEPGAGRPGVYKTRGTAGGFANEDFTGSGVAKFHDNCRCTIEAVFSADYQLEPHIAEAEKLYFESTVNSAKGESLNDFRRALEAVRAGKPIPVLPSKVHPIKPVSPADALAALFSRLPKPAA